MSTGLSANLEVRQGEADFSFEGSRAGLFWSILRARAGMLVKLNLLIAVFAVPAVFALFWFSMQSTVIGALTPFSANLGIGYPAVSDAAVTAAGLRFINDMYLHLALTGGIVLLCVGLSGGFYVMRQLARGEVFPVIKTFFIGIKRHVLPFLCAAPFLAGFYFLIAGGICAYAELSMPAGLKIFLLIVIIMVAAYAVFAAIFYFTQAVTYKIKTVDLLKNSFLLAAKLLPRNLLILAVSAVPFVLLYFLMTVSIINILVIMLAVLFLFSFIILLWTVYGHWVFDKFFESKETEQTDGKERKIIEIPVNKTEVILDEEKKAEPEKAEKVKQAASENSSESKSQKEKPAKEPNRSDSQSPQKKSAAFKFKTKK